MGKRYLIVVLLILFCKDMLNSQITVNVNYDKKTLEQLTLNTSAQISTNTLHNNQVNSIKKKQSKLMTLVSGIAAEKELLIQTYQNVAGFRKESKYYIAMVATGADIVNHSSMAMEVINKSKWTGKTMMILNVSNLVTKAVSLGKAFADIVANSEVPNPIKHPDATSGDKDKHNLLNRYERLSMANDILFRLKEIDRSICYLTYLCKTCDVKDLVFQIDRESYLNYIMTNININDMISKWNRVKN